MNSCGGSRSSADGSASGAARALKTTHAFPSTSGLSPRPIRSCAARPMFFYVVLFLLNGVIAFAVITGRWNESGVAGGIFLVLMAVTFRKRTVYRFQYLTGKHAFDVWKMGPQRSCAEDFAKSVVAAIESATSQSGGATLHSEAIGRAETDGAGTGTKKAYGSGDRST